MSANANTKTKGTQRSKKAEKTETAVVKTDGTQVKTGIQSRKTVVCVVVSDKMSKTIVVKVDRRVRDPLYKKYVTRSHRFKAHDETNQAKVGDLVSLVETRPLSRDKRWALQTIIRRGGIAPEVNV